MEPSPEPPFQDTSPNETTPISADLPPDIPIRVIAMRPYFPDPDPISAVPKDYFPVREELGKYMGQLKAGLQTLVQGPLDYRLVSFMNSWNNSNIGVEQTEFDTAARLVLAVLDAGPSCINTTQTKTPLGAEDWGTLASTCLAAIGRGFTRPLKEVSRKSYTNFWENIDDNPQRMLDEGENPEFHSLLQRLKATSQHLDIHMNADESDGLRKWTSVVRKEAEETAKRAAVAEVEIALTDWKVNQLSVRQQQLEETLRKTTLERNIDLLRSTAESLGLTVGDPSTIPHSRPIPLTGNKRTASGSAPLPALSTSKAKSTPLQNIADGPASQAPQIDVITLTAAVQTAMQPFMARLEAAERRAAPTHYPSPPLAAERLQTTAPRDKTGHAAQTQQTNMHERPKMPTEQHNPEDWVQVTNKRKRGKVGKNADQANPTPQQINLTPRSYAEMTGAIPTTTLAQPQKHTQQNQVTNNSSTITEVTVVRFGGAILSANEQAVRKRRPDAIIREVKANMMRAVAKPLPITMGRWSLGARSKGNFVFTMQGHIDFRFIQAFESFLTNPFPGGGQLCPNQGWTKLLAHGVPVTDNDEVIFGPADLQQEVRTMQGLRNVYFSASPRWIKPVERMTSNYSSLTFAFSDPDGSITKGLLENKQALFGKQVQIERWVDKPLLVQCGRCHALGHAASSKACRLPRDSVRCYICGKGHKAEVHNRECPRASLHKQAGTCDCRLQCLTCNKVGHHTRDPTCPAREGYRSRKPRIIPKNKGKEREHLPPDLPSEIPVQHTKSPLPPQAARVDDTPDEEMPDMDITWESNFIPRHFLPGPGLSREEAFRKWMESAEEGLKVLDTPYPDEQDPSVEDLANRDREMKRRTLFSAETSPTEKREAEQFDLAEALIMVLPGYFHPGMPTERQRQLAAIISTGTPNIVNLNTPGVASTSTTLALC